MPEKCCAQGCNQERDKDHGISLYRIPVELERREKWISAIRRENADKTKWLPTKHTRLCSRHFVSGAKSDHPLHPDYVPSIFHHIPSPKQRSSIAAVENFTRRQDLKRRKIDSSAELDVFERPTTKSECVATSADHDAELLDAPPFGHCNSDQCKVYFKSLETECQALRTENMELKKNLQNVKFDESAFIDNDDKVRSFTGLPSYTKLMGIFTCVEPYLFRNSSIPPFEQFILTLIRLRLNVTLTFLSYMFNTSLSSASRIFNNCLNVMHVRLVPSLVQWPERDQLRKTLPYAFRIRSSFSKCVCIIDCFEIFIEKPNLYKAKAESYSSYKSHNTMKYLIGICPQGCISFISTGWGGRTSDKHIVENSGFLKHLLPGDLVLADRGFNVADSVALYNAELRIPAFTKGHKQLDAIELEKTRGLAAVRIHVERVIGHARQKYSIMNGPIPITLLDSPDEELMTLDKIVHVCCGLTNVSESVVPFG